VLGDNCDFDSECQTKNCKQSRCDLISDREKYDRIYDGVIKVVFILIFIVAIVLWTQNRRQSHRHSSFNKDLGKRGEGGNESGSKGQKYERSGRHHEEDP